MILDHDMEKLLIAHCLQSKESTGYIAGMFGVDEADFQDTFHQILFGACCSLFAKNQDVNALSIQTFLLEEVHGNYFVGRDRNNEIERLIKYCEEVAHDYNSLKSLTSPYTAAQHLKSQTKRRRAITIISSIYTNLTKGVDLENPINKKKKDLISYAHSMQEISYSSYRTLDDTIEEIQVEIEEESSGNVNYLSTGFESIDKMITGLFRGRLYIVAAAAKVGKSLLCSKIAYNVASNGNAVGIISMEMSGREITRRLSGISQYDENETKKEKLKAFSKIAKAKKIYYRQGGTTPKTLLTTMQKMITEMHCQLIVLDYLQLISIEEKYSNAVDGINSMLGKIKAFALENQVVIILISAVLTKNLKYQKYKKPSAADLAGSGRPANDCDVMLLMWNPDQDNRKQIEVFVEVSRNGESGKTILLLDDELQITSIEVKSGANKKIAKSINDDIFSKNWK